MAFYFKILLTLSVISTALPTALSNSSPYYDSVSDLADYLASKNYVPKENILPKVSLVKNIETDILYLLSKLSDTDLLNLLNDQPSKTEYDLNDIIRIADKYKYKHNKKYIISTERYQLYNSGKMINKQESYKKNIEKIPVFRLDDKEIDPFIMKHDTETKIAAEHKIKNLLFSRPQKINPEESGGTNEEKKEMLFDILVGQLKSLCCKKKQIRKNQNIDKTQIKTLLSVMIAQNVANETDALNNKYLQAKEYLFLVINDEIKSNESEELLPVDTESIGNNSSVLILGPISTTLTNQQLKLVMSRISNELSKSEYLPLLQQLSEGVLNKVNKSIIKSVISGPDTRRYIKPHRCNHHSKLAKVYGGPKWIICTGYLNLNSPSLYDT